MALPSPNLDDLRFQSDLVDGARRRIIHYCPEWTEYNLSDPGITLIELFAWMTEMIVYRLNQVPEKNYIEFLNLLGMQREPASSARTDLTFWLSVSLPITPENEEPVIVPQGIEVISRPLGEEAQVTFTTDRALTIVPPKLTQLRREEDFQKNYLPRLGVETFYAFDQTKPKAGDTFYLGFDETQNISGHILQLNFECERTQAVGVRREDPPWVWECSLGNGVWREVMPSMRQGEKDTTGGLNNPHGSLVLYLPLDMRPDQVFGRNALWVRCRIEPRRPEQGMYSESPRVTGITAFTLGASVPATHAVIVENELLGRSTGEPNQHFTLEHAPILALQDGETIEVEEWREGEIVFVPWQCVDNFAHSDRYDRHFTVDAADGIVTFGPAIRQPDGTVRQYGRVPEAGRQIRFTRYRYGGGVAGNVPVDTLQGLTTSLAYISRVTNLRRASGGRDAESLEEVKVRARRELKAQLRAVTAEDYGHLAKGASRSVARVKCNVPQRADAGARDHRVPPGTVEILIVPAAFDSLRANDLTRLHIDETLAKTVETHLDQYRLLTTTLRIQEPNYLGVKVNAQIIPSEFSQPEVVRARVAEALRTFISPLDIADEAAKQDALMDATWEGWPFGRNLYVAEIFSLIQRVPGVKHVVDVQLSTRPVIPKEELPPGEEMRPDQVNRREAKLTPVQQKVIHVPADTLLCSLDHDIGLATLEEELES
ncbi:MAG TPA: putative baseplate assembly protein [Anaerolineae bacterium]|nr:putative baseplate assembly protein [Anaerolineae bacterium]HQH37983.1 putative baseplate assembly protein [Anaerolineae bacterium]